MSKKIVKCKICEKNITTRSKGKKFRHCGTDQLIKNALIEDLTREKPKKEVVEKKEIKKDYPEDNINLPPEKRKPKEVKKGEKESNDEKTKEKPRNDREEDDWGY